MDDVEVVDDRKFFEAVTVLLKRGAA